MTRSRPTPSEIPTHLECRRPRSFTPLITPGVALICNRHKMHQFHLIELPNPVKVAKHDSEARCRAGGARPSTVRQAGRASAAVARVARTGAERSNREGADVVARRATEPCVIPLAPPAGRWAGHGQAQLCRWP